MDQPGSLQLLQGLGEHDAGDALQPPLEFVKADYLLLVELPQDAQLPLAAYQPQGKFDRTALHGVASPLSIFLPAKEKLRTCTFFAAVYNDTNKDQKRKGVF